MKWHSRDKKLKRKRSQKEMGKPFRRERAKDSPSEKKISKYFKQLRQVAKRAEEDDQDDADELR